MFLWFKSTYGGFKGYKGHMVFGMGESIKGHMRAGRVERREGIFNGLKEHKQF